MDQNQSVCDVSGGLVAYYILLILSSAILQYSSLISIPIKFLLLNFAILQVVPLPHIGSNIISLSLEKFFIIKSASSSGKIAP